MVNCRDAGTSCRAGIRKLVRGTSRDRVEERRRRGADVLLEIDWQGAAQVRERNVEAITTQVLPPSVEALARRLRERGQDDEASIAERIGSARRELSHYPDFDYLVVNERFGEALEELEAIVRAERARTPARSRSMATLLDRLLLHHESGIAVPHELAPGRSRGRLSHPPKRATNSTASPRQAGDDLLREPAKVESTRNSVSETRIPPGDSGVSRPRRTINRIRQATTISMAMARSRRSAL